MIRVAICLAGALFGAQALPDQAREREVWACLAETPDVTDSNVEKVWKACKALVEYRRRSGRWL